MEHKLYDVIALGELLIDFTENAISPQGNQLFEANPGGAPCNVLAMLHKLGQKTAFIGKVGNDQFGLKLKEVLNSTGISTAYLYLDNQIPTTLAFVHTFEDGDRDFSFYRNPGADMMLTEQEVREEAIRSAKAFHHGTLSMTHEGVRNATKKALQLAKKHHLLITFDPNLREPLWENLADAKEQILYGLSQCDAVKISEEELEFVTGISDIKEAAFKIKEEYSIPLICVTLGKKGSIAFYQDLVVERKPFLQQNTIETTGAGDTFCASMIHFILKYGLSNLDKEKLTEMLTFANAAASLITTKKGALCVMPSEQEVIQFIQEKEKVLSE